MQPLQARFEEKYLPEPTSGCWLWIAGSRGRYGAFWYEGKMLSAHRVSYLLRHRYIPENMLVLHKCDNTFCVNPDHLYCGTRFDNMRDMVDRGRNNNPRGADAPWSKLTLEQVKGIRSDSRVQAIIAKEYGIVQSHVSNIKAGLRW